MPTQHTLDTRWIPVARIHPNPDNPRHDLGDLDDLASSIASVGVQQPVVVHPHPDVDGDFMLIAGHRRRAAAEQAGVVEIPGVVRDQPDQVTLLELMLAENLQRAALDPIDEAKALAKIKASGKYRRLDDIAAHVHRSKQWVAGRLALVAKLPEACWAAIRSGDVTLAEAQAVAGLPAEVDQDERRRLLLEVPPAQRAHEVGRAQRLAETERRRAKLTADYGELRSTLPPWRQGWGNAHLGSAPFQLNVPGPMHSSCPGHWPMWNGNDAEPRVYCTRPELHQLSEFVAPPEEHDEDGETLWADMADWPALVAGGAVPVGDLADGVAEVHDRCPHDQVIEVPWGEVVLCTSPAVHDPASPEHIPLDELADRDPPAVERPEGGASPAPRPRPTRPAEPRWEPSDRLVEEVRSRLAVELDELSEPVRQLLVWACNLWDEERDPADLTAGVVDELRRPVWDRLREPALWGEEEGRFARMWLWVLSAVTDVGEPLPTLDAVATRLEVLTRGDTAGEVSGG